MRLKSPSDAIKKTTNRLLLELLQQIVMFLSFQHLKKYKSASVTHDLKRVCLDLAGINLTLIEPR